MNPEDEDEPPPPCPDAEPDSPPIIGDAATYGEP